MEKVTIIPPPKEVDPRVLAWKGAAVLAKMDGVSELWVTANDWVRRHLPLFYFLNWCAGCLRNEGSQRALLLSVRIVILLYDALTGLSTMRPTIASLTDRNDREAVISRGHNRI
jgi:hypothetical protein